MTVVMATGVFTHRAQASPAQPDSGVGTTEATPTASADVTGAANQKVSPSWPHSLGLRSEPSNFPHPVPADMSSTASSRAPARDGRGAMLPAAAAPAAAEATAASALDKVSSGDASETEAVGGGQSILPVSQVPSVLTEVTTCGAGGRAVDGGSGQLGGMTQQHRRPWGKLLGCICPQPEQSLGRQEIIAMSDAMPDAGSPEKDVKCAAIRLPSLGDAPREAAVLCGGTSVGDSVDLDTFQELDDGGAAAAPVVEASESEDEESDDDRADAAQAPLVEADVQAELARVAMAAQGVYKAAAAAAAALSARDSSAADKREVPLSSGSIDLTAVLGESAPGSPRLLAAFGYRHRQGRSRAQLGGPSSEDTGLSLLQRQATGRTSCRQPSLRGSLGITGLDSVASSMLNGGSKRWALKSVGGGDAAPARMDERGNSLVESCARVFLRARHSVAALEAGEDLSWMAFAGVSFLPPLQGFLL